MTDDDVRGAKSPRQRHREACAALDAAVAANDADAMREALRQIKAADDGPDDPLLAAVNERLRYDDNRARAHMGVPTEEEE
jgi:hypothetical protein